MTTFCRQHDFLREIEKHTELSDAEKLRKIVLELVDTEKNYLKVGVMFRNLLIIPCSVNTKYAHEIHHITWLEVWFWVFWM